MLITFSSDVSPDIVLFGDVATLFLRAMGESEQPPGILRGDNIKLAAARLQAWLNTVPEQDNDTAEDDDSTADDTSAQQHQSVGLKRRAWPLLDMMERAYQEDCDVIWR